MWPRTFSQEEQSFSWGLGDEEALGRVVGYRCSSSCEPFKARGKPRSQCLRKGRLCKLPEWLVAVACPPYCCCSGVSVGRRTSHRDTKTIACILCLHSSIIVLSKPLFFIHRGKQGEQSVSFLLYCALKEKCLQDPLRNPWAGCNSVGVQLQH